MANDISDKKLEALKTLAGRQIREIYETEGKTETIARVCERAARIGRDHSMLCAQLLALCRKLGVEDSEVLEPIKEAQMVDLELLTAATFIELFPDSEF